MHKGRGGWGFREEPPAGGDAQGWIAGAIPDEWFTSRPEVVVDRDEILIIGTLAAPAGAGDGSDDGEADTAPAEHGRIAAFREETRERRIRLARQLEHRYRRKV